MAKIPKFLEQRFPNPALLGVKKEDFATSEAEEQEKRSKKTPKFLQNKQPLPKSIQEAKNALLGISETSKEVIEVTQTGKQKDSYTMDEVAQMLGVSKQTLGRYIKAGLLKVQKEWRNYYVSKEELQRFCNVGPAKGYTTTLPKPIKRGESKFAHVKID